MKPNIVLIMTDQMRGDCLGIQGHPNVETPNLDAMARDGVRFNSAYSAVPSCIAARAALLTGQTQKTHGRVGYKDKVDWNYKHTMPEEFAKAGYHTQCVGKMHVHPTRNLCGFHNVVLHDGYLHNRNYSNRANEHWKQTDDYLPWLRQQAGFSADMIDSGLECNSWVARPWPYAEHLHPTNWVVTQSIDFLRRRDISKPFFLNLSFVRPHSPLDPPKVYYDQYINEDLNAPPVGDWAEKDDPEQNGLIIDAKKGILSKRAQKRAQAAYYGLITHIDHQIGRFMQALQEYEVFENTIFLFTADHGDMLGDHNIFRKAVPFEGSVSIPFLIYDPGKLLDINNKVIDDPVEIRDIMPTLLDFADIEIPKTVEGKSVRNLIEKNSENWREYIHGEHSYGSESNHYIATGKEKYIWFSQTGKELYFDIESDPKELHDLSKEKPKRVEYWRNILIEELEDREEGYSDGNRLITGQEPKAVLKHTFTDKQ